MVMLIISIEDWGFVGLGIKDCWDWGLEMYQAYIGRKLLFFRFFLFFYYIYYVYIMYMKKIFKVFGFVKK
jgi:hypothetical protein